ncbi:MAG TPA: alpha/beta fold hydrolase [Pyrinomonadaceae bacterium]|nr:alpha/beta fold hydrolase [Pyrinomonadaceae bacterium]
MRKRIWALIVFVFLAGGSHVCAQTQQTVSGEWVGNTEAKESGTQFITLSLSGNTGTLGLPLGNFSTPLTSIKVEGNQVICEFGQIKATLKGTIDGDKITGEASSPGSTGTFHVTRVQKLAPEALAAYQGAYRFPDGKFVLIDVMYGVPSLLTMTDSATGEVRGIFPRTGRHFFAGPALFITSPMTTVLTFERNGERIVGLSSQSGSRVRRAKRIFHRHQSVRFQNGDVTLAGTLLLPEASRSKHAGVVFTHGGGAARREFVWGLGYQLAARGMAVLIYDKRGVGESKGNWGEASFEDLADDAVAGAKFLQSNSEIDPKRIGFWGLSQGGWIAPLAASRFPDAAFAVAISGGALTPAVTELFDTEYELQKAGFSAEDVQKALAFQSLKNEIIRSFEKWEQYLSMRTTVKDLPWYRVQGIDIRGPDKQDHPQWAHMRRSYFYDPAPALKSLRGPLLVIHGELDTPKGVAASVEAIKSILTAAGKRETSITGDSGKNGFVVKVYPRGVHNLMEAPEPEKSSWIRSKRFVPGLFEEMVNWMVRQSRSRAPGRTSRRS